MTVYIAARAKYRSKEVAEIQRRVQDLGYGIAYDWPSGNNAIKKPYRLPENRKANNPAQVKMLKAAASADIFIFLDDPGLRGAYIELGAFLTDCIDNPAGRKAYIVGPDSQARQFIFESPDYVMFAESIEDVFKDLAKLT